MTVWISNNITLTEPFTFDHPDQNVVILGALNSVHDITFKVNNLIVFGQITSTKNITLNTVKDFFNGGKVDGDNLNITGASIYNGIGDIAYEKIRALGVNLNRSANGGFTVFPPQ